MKKVFVIMLFTLGIAWIYHAVLVKEKSEVVPEVVEIFSYFKGYIPDEKYDQVFNQSKPEILQLNELAQTYFIRPKGSERTDETAMAHYKKLYSHLKKEEFPAIISCFRKIGDIDAVYPLNPSPDYILIQGSTVPNMRGRVMFIAHLLESGRLKLKPNTQIAFLVGERKLFTSETDKVLVNTSPYKMRTGWQKPENLPTDEREAAKMVWEQLDLPDSLRNMMPHFVGAEKKVGEQRAQTEDCVGKWLSTPDLKGGSCLVISSNPFVHYQQRVTERGILKSGREKDFTVEGAGFAAPVTHYLPEMALGVLLDNLARTLYTEKQIKELQDKKAL